MFIKDIYKMIDFISLSKGRFLNKYLYIDSLEYDITKDMFYSDIVKHVVYMYNEILKIKWYKNKYLDKLNEFIRTLSYKVQSEIKKEIKI